MFKGLWFAHVQAIAYNRPIRHIVLLMVLAATLIPTGISAAPTATAQDFDNPGAGTLYEKYQFGTPPGPAPTQMAGGPTGLGNFLRLVSIDPDNKNTIVFPNIIPASNLIIADFDFRI